MEWSYLDIAEGIGKITFRDRMWHRVPEPSGYITWSSHDGPPIRIRGKFYMNSQGVGTLRVKGRFCELVDNLEREWRSRLKSRPISDKRHDPQVKAVLKRIRALLVRLQKLGDWELKAGNSSSA